MLAMRMFMAVLVGAAMTVQAFAKPAEPTDLLNEATVSEPSLSPDGMQVAYTVKTIDFESDSSESHIWIANVIASSERQVTGREGESETTPRFSPDGSWLGFLSSRGKSKDEPTRLWLLPLAGGEAQPVEGIAGSVNDFAWSPNGEQLALIVKDPKPEADDENDRDKPQPIVIDRFWFKDDGVGYLDNRRDRLWLYDLPSSSLVRLTNGDYDEIFPAFSPDGSKVAFVSKRGEDFDRTFNTDIFIADIATPGDAPRQLTTYEGADSTSSYPAWSPDGSRIAYVRGGDPEKIWYGINSLALVDANGGKPDILTNGLDRNVESPVWNEDGSAIRFIVEDDGRAYLARVIPDQSLVETLTDGDFKLEAPTAIRSGKMALLQTSSFTPAEVFVFAANELTKLSTRNDGWLTDLELGSVRRSAFASADGTEVHSLIYLPPNFKPDVPHPTVLNLHGGPASQFAHSWDTEILWQLLAGYVVIAPNPRGSTGRGEAFSMAGHSAWGALDVQDVLAAVDDSVGKGISDPERLAVSGWSYGGMLTNYVIASDDRFKAAISGSSISNIITGFGHDMYIREYIAELGTPWENLEAWMAISYPFFENQRIQTPTLFIVGGEDVNVPTIASEQMYQSLKVRGIPTRLVIYPGEYHTLTRPSFLKDRIERWNAWLDLYLED